MVRRKEKLLISSLYLCVWRFFKMRQQEEKGKRGKDKVQMRET